jgi:predicted lysophospholipase L1 biosynthesis ABC-type transport system permease subunit
MVEPLEDRKLGVVIVAYLASVVLLVFGAGAAVRNRYWLAAALFGLAFLVFGVVVWQALRWRNASFHDLRVAITEAHRQRKRTTGQK